METAKLQKLKIAANKFYLNTFQNEPEISDKEYDSLVKEYETEMKKSVKDLVDWPEQLVLPNVPEEPLEKEIVKDNDLKNAFETWANSYKEDIWVNYKYDGAAIKLIYDEKGQLKTIQSTPDEKMGIVRTEQFWNLVPHQIPAGLGIQCIRGEVLVDANVYGKLSRNKANGLVNSTVNQDQINNEAFIRWYKITYFDGDWSSERQIADGEWINSIYMTRIRQTQPDGTESKVHDRVFACAEIIPEFPTQPIITEASSEGLKFQVDGIVAYALHELRGFKFYFTDEAVTRVTDVVWNEQPNGSYAAVLQIEPVELDGKTVKQVTSGGVRNLMGLSDNSPGAMGVGAKIGIILANTTIPKVIKVYEPSEQFNWPKCDCGYQMGPDDVYGNVLKCGNLDVCCTKVDLWMDEVIHWIKTDQLFTECISVKQCIRTSPIFFGYLARLDRWDPFDKFLEGDQSIMADELINIVNSEVNSKVKGSDYVQWMKRYFKLSELQLDNLTVNAASAVKVLSLIYNENIGR